MKKKTLSLLTILSVLSVRVQAFTFEINPTSFLDAWHRTNHWLGIGALTIMAACLTAIWKAPPISNVHKARAFEFAVKSGCILSFLLFYMEVHWYFDAIAANAIELTKDIWNY